MGVYPSIINAITLLSPKCHAVHIYSSERESNFPEPPSFPKNVTFYKVKQHYKYNRNQYQVPTQIESNTNHHLPSSLWKRFLPESLKEFYRRIRAVFFENLESWHAQSLWFKDKIRYYSFSLKQSTRSRSDILIAVDVSGLIAASLVSLFSKISPIVIFWSLEIDTNKSNLLLHRFHKYLFSKCFLTCLTSSTMNIFHTTYTVTTWTDPLRPRQKPYQKMRLEK